MTTAELLLPSGDQNHRIQYLGVTPDLRQKVIRAVVIAGNRSAFRPFLQGDSEGWALVEFWTDDPQAISEGVAFFEREAGLQIKLPPPKTS